MSLAELQRSFTAYLRDGESAITSEISPGSRRGLPVYHYAFRATLKSCLADTFERVHAWLGDAAFEVAAVAHIAATPPGSWTLADYGAGFDATCARLYSDDPEVAELAWLDWALRCAFDGPDAPALDLSRLGEIDWDSARLMMAPTLTMRLGITNAPAIWRAIADGGTPPAACRIDQPTPLTVWRHGLSPMFQSVGATEWQAMTLAQGGTSFGGICAALVRDGDADGALQEAAAMLQRWIAEGVLTAVASGEVP